MKGRRWVYYGLCLVALPLLLLNIFFTKNTNAAVIEMDAPTSGWINCDTTTEVHWYTSPAISSSQPNPIVTNCSKWSNQLVSSNNIDFFRLRIFFANTNNQYKFKQDAYALVTFSMGIIGTKAVLPTGFIGRNVNVLESSVDFEKDINNIIPLLPNGSVGASQNAINYEVNTNTTYAIYNLKIRIPAGTAWDGTLDLQQGMTMPSQNNIFQLFISSVRMGYIYEPNAAINEEAQQELNDRDNLESQSQQTDSDASNSEQQIQSGTSNLISVVTSFSNAMIGVRTTNCKLPRMTAYDFDLGELDLCTYSPPAWIQTITSAVVSLIVVRLAYKIFKRIMGIAKGISK